MNSRPHLNVSLRDSYRDANPRCELYALLKNHLVVNHWCVKVPLSRINPDAAIEVNHIFSNGQRPDIWPNLISVSWQVHKWFHANLQEGRCVCLIAKYLKGGRDWDLEELREASGKNPLCYLDIELPWPDIERLRQQIVREVNL